MYGVNSLYIIMLVQNAPYRSEHIVHGVSQIFSSMCSDENHTAPLAPFQLRMGIVGVHGSFQCVYSRIASDEYIAFAFSFPKEICLGQLCRRKMKCADDTYCLTVELFRIRALDVVGSKARFYMAHRNLEIETAQGGGKGSSSIAMH